MNLSLQKKIFKSRIFIDEKIKEKLQLASQGFRTNHQDSSE